jgi:hypothetical protein
MAYQGIIIVGYDNTIVSMDRRRKESDLRVHTAAWRETAHQEKQSVNNLRGSPWWDDIYYGIVGWNIRKNRVEDTIDLPMDDMPSRLQSLINEGGTFIMDVQVGNEVIKFPTIIYVTDMYEGQRAYDTSTGKDIGSMSDSILNNLETIGAPSGAKLYMRPMGMKKVEYRCKVYRLIRDGLGSVNRKTKIYRGENVIQRDIPVFIIENNKDYLDIAIALGIKREVYIVRDGKGSWLVR